MKKINYHAILYVFLAFSITEFPRPIQTKVGHKKNIVCMKNLTSSSGPDSNQCQGRKFELYSRFCLDINLPYKATTLPEYVPGLQINSAEDAYSYLESWQGARLLPKCWPYLQVALCSILMPRYEDSSFTNKIASFEAPSVDICNDVVDNSNCKFIERHFGWPSIFNCSDHKLYSRNCTNELRGARPNLSPEVCKYPLVPSNQSDTSFRGIGGCTIHCKFPILDPRDQTNIGLMIRVVSLLGLIVSSIAIILFTISARNGRMTKVIQRCCMWKSISYIGWSLQLLSSDDIACSANGSALTGLPLVANACVLSFFLSYIPQLASYFWCSYLAKICFEELHSVKENSEKLKIGTTISVLSYVVPLGLFVTVATLGQIDGHGLYGICSVSQKTIIVKMIFDIIPSVVGTLYSDIYFILAIKTMMANHSSKPKDSIPMEAKPMDDKLKNTRLKHNLMRISLLAVFGTLHMILSVVNFIYEHENRSRWMDSVESYVACTTNLESIIKQPYDMESRPECSIETKPIVLLYYIEQVPSLLIGFVFASWFIDLQDFGDLKDKLIEALGGEVKKSRTRPKSASFSELSQTRRAGNIVELSMMHSRDSLGSVSIFGNESIRSLAPHRNQALNLLKSREVIAHQRMVNADHRNVVEKTDPEETNGNADPMNGLPPEQMAALLMQLMMMGHNRPDLPEASQPETGSEREFLHGMGGQDVPFVVSPNDATKF